MIGVPNLNLGSPNVIMKQEYFKLGGDNLNLTHDNYKSNSVDSRLVPINFRKSCVSYKKAQYDLSGDFDKWY